MLEAVAGLQTQYAPSGYIGLWSRMHRFERTELTQALESRRVIQGTLMRATIHMVSAADYWPAEVAVRGARREWWLRAARSQIKSVDPDGIARAIRDELAAGPLRQKELSSRLKGRGYDGPQSGSTSWPTSCACPRPGPGSSGAPTSMVSPRNGYRRPRN